MLGKKLYQKNFSKKSQQCKEDNNELAEHERKTRKFDTLYDKILFNILLNNHADKRAVLEKVRNIFVILPKDHEIKVKEIQERIKNYKFDKISEHSDLMITVLTHEFKATKFSKFEPISDLGSFILSSDANSKHLSSNEIIFAKWFAFIEIQKKLDVLPKVYQELIGNLIRNDNGTFRISSDDDKIIAKFGESQNILMTSCLNFIENSLILEDSDNNREILQIYFEVVQKLSSTQSIDFSGTANNSFEELVKKSIAIAASKYLLSLQTNFVEEKAEKRLDQMIEILSALINQFESSVQKYGDTFKR